MQASALGVNAAKPAATAPAKKNSTISASIIALQQEAKRNLEALESEEKDDDDPADTDEDESTGPIMTDEPIIPLTEQTPGPTSAQTPSTPSNLNDEDAKCYSSRYQDIDAMLDPKTHYSTVGIQQGRLGTCARRLTDYEAQRYLNENPDLQRLFGKKGASSLSQARDHWQSVGYKSTTLSATVKDEENVPFQCGKGPSDSCQCPGMLWFGLQTRPDNGAKIETFDEMREWRTIGAESDDWQTCSVVEFGSDPMPGVDKQCFCEVEPAYTATRCADEGDECICNGHVYFAPRFENDNTTPANFWYIQENPFAVTDANNTGTMTCSSDSFEDADPSPEVAKQCFCDDKRKFLSAHDVGNIQEYWRQTMLMSQTEVEIQTVVMQTQETAVLDESLTGSDDDLLKSVGDDGDADLIAAGCKLCDESCSADSQSSLTKEIEKQKTVVKRKYESKKIVNKQKKTHAHNKRVQGESACNAAQKAKDPAEKKKQKKMCKELKEEASKIETEAKIEEQNINDQQQQEEKEIADDTQAAVKEQTDKTNTNKKSQEINKAKLKEQKASRITKEAEERIEVIKKKMESERIETTTLTTQTTAMEKQVSVIQKQIEDVENQLINEIKTEKEESLDAGEENDEDATEAESELTEVIEAKKTELVTKKEKATAKKE